MLASLRAAGVLSGLDEHFAQAMSRISGEGRAEVLLAAALASRQVGEGNVCLDLARPPNLTDDEGTPVAPPWPAADRWTDLVRSSPLVSSTSPVPARPKANRRSASGPSPCKGEGGRRPGEGAAPTPLLLHGTRLYLRRYWEHEQLVARIVRERSTIVEAGVDDDLLASGLARLFPEAADTGPQRGFWDAPDDGQRVAAATAVRRGLTVISGGPGTGKTFTVAKVLALLVEQAFARRAAAPRIALLAPTGKAAARLQESVARAKAGLGCDGEVLAAIPDEASTIHRALSPIAGSSTRFRRRHDDPLPADVVIVDEASMVDLALMARLLDAVPASSRLILLGDKDQLASVEAGAVLADVVAAGGPSIVELSTSRRYGAASPIGELARAINAGDAAAALGVLDARAGDLELVEPPASGGLETALADRIVEIFGGVLAAERPADRLAGLDRLRVLCAHRRGRLGAEAVNALVLASLGDDAGLPIMITRNDYSVGVYNGDLGLIVDGGGGANVALLSRSDGSLRSLSPSRLPAHEPAFATTVHKSQGSEFDEVVIVLPNEPSPVISRELLYTAVTRARRRVVIQASREILRRAIETPAERTSGLRQALAPGDVAA